MNKAISKILENRTSTVILVAHRLSSIAQADRVVVIDGGEVVEDGKFDQLVSRSRNISCFSFRNPILKHTYTLFQTERGPQLQVLPTDVRPVACRCSRRGLARGRQRRSIDPSLSFGIPQRRQPRSSHKRLILRPSLPLLRHLKIRFLLTSRPFVR